MPLCIMGKFPGALPMPASQVACVQRFPGLEYKKTSEVFALVLVFGLKANLKTSDHDREWKFAIAVLV